jgi:hypothetical protein
MALPRSVKGTKVLSVQKHNLSFLTGVPVEIGQENGDNKEVKYYLRVAKWGEN